MAGTPQQGYYAASVGPSLSRPALAGHRTTDICVIGAGYTGLSAALHIAEAGARVLVLEAESVGFGASGRNGGQIHSGWRKDQRELEQWLGPLHARDLWGLAQEAKALVRKLIERHAIDCELKLGLVSAAHSARAARALARDTEHMSTVYGYSGFRILSAEECCEEIGSRIYRAGRFDAGGGHLHPLLYARGLALAAERAGAEICEQSAVLGIEIGRSSIDLTCAGGRARAGRVILATDAFVGELVPSLDRYVGRIESFVTATAPLPSPLYHAILPRDFAVADTRHVLDYYRKSADRRLLFAGREACFRRPSDIAALVRPRLLRVFPQLREIPIEYAWSGTVGITVTRMPHFGKIADGLSFGHGYSGQGVALATLGGSLLAEAASGREERFDVLARIPPREFPGGQALRRPLLAAGLLAYKLVDAF
ncbi:MAG: NAD(P)/FAD-dependent oxidoreductase [Rhizomicrobium sp.]